MNDGLRGFTSSSRRITEGLKKYSFEKDAWGQKKMICGIDEVGRGCLAGPIVAAAIVLKNFRGSRSLKDSKLLSAVQLLRGYAWIEKNAWIGVGIINNDIIDRCNIYQATLHAMSKAITNLLVAAPESPAAILIDAMPLKLDHTAYQAIPVHYFPHGERYSISIAAASIIAKVTRDNLMKKFDEVFPGYHFGQHKGYGTRLHQNAIKKHGRTIIHRASFLSTSEGLDSECQQSFL